MLKPEHVVTVAAGYDERAGFSFIRASCSCGWTKRCHGYGVKPMRQARKSAEAAALDHHRNAEVPSGRG